MDEFKEEAEKLHQYYRQNKLPAPSLRKQLVESGYMETVYDEFRDELTTIKNSIVSSADEAQKCNAIMDDLVRQLKDKL
ncbi:hypothetical protein [Flavobacterium soli]|uniref:hypothetical protein n=1 Tax=Flavobacterium soli TaxID=344881 RepID=UPI0004076D08|nr:hypothetical protein [Flavobacterium soli]